MTYKAIFFDVGNTLLYPFPSVEIVCAEILKSHGYNASLEDISEALKKADAYYEKRYKEDDTFWASEKQAASLWEDLYALALNEVGIDGEAAKLAREIYETFGLAEKWRPYPDVIPVLKILKDKGLTLGIISNWDTRLASLCVELGLSTYLDFVISSASVGRLKPQPHIFEIALKRAKVLPEEAIHIGDHYYADVMGARSVGITPVLIDRKGNHFQLDCSIITSLEEFLTLGIL